MCIYSRHSFPHHHHGPVLCAVRFGLNDDDLFTLRDTSPRQHSAGTVLTHRSLLVVTGVTAASSGTHTRWCRKQASSLALSSAPVAAGRASSLAPWRTLNGMCRYRRGAAETGRGLRDAYTA